MNKRVLVIAGPTGSGESTVTREITSRFPVFVRLVTATSRKERLGEKEGIDYYFFSKDRFEKEIARKNILEYTYVKNRDVYYGAYKPALDRALDSGKNVIANTDIVGARFYKENYSATTIFIRPESLDILRSRLIKRDPSITKEELEKRIGNAESEIRNEEPFYDHSVVNAEGKLEEALENIIKIIRKDGYNLDGQAGN